MTDAPKVYIVVGGPVFEASTLAHAEEIAHDLALKNDDAPFGTIIAIEKEWKKSTMVAENRGVVLSIPDEVRNRDTWTGEFHD